MSSFIPIIITKETYPYLYEPYKFEPIDAQCVTDYQYRYVNNGIDVTIKGAYENVQSVLNVLNSFPPVKKYEKKHINLPSFDTDNVQGQVVGNHIWLKINDTVYSGSGSLIMVVQANKPLKEAKFVLFRSSSNGKYADLGGRIDKPTDPTTLNADTLFNNAIKEVKEESVNLFNINSKSTNSVDVLDKNNKTYYKLYLYLIQLDSDKIDNLSTWFDKNRVHLLSSFGGYFGAEYRETDKLELFDYQTFMDTLKRLGAGTYDMSNAFFKTINGSFVKVMSRTINAIVELDKQNMFNDMFANNKVSSSDIKTSANVTNIYM